MARDPDEYDEWLYEQHINALEREEEYDSFQRHFKAEAAQQLVNGVAATHQRIATDINRELLHARDALLRNSGDDDRVLSLVRSYRAIDWYLMTLTESIFDAFVEPYTRFFDKPKPWSFLNKDVMALMRSRVLREAFNTTTVMEQINTFFNAHHKLRNEVMHGIRIPTQNEARSVLAAAVAIFNAADTILNPTAPINFTI